MNQSSEILEYPIVPEHGVGFLLWGRADQIGNSGTGQGRARAAAARVDIWPRIIWGGLYGGHMVTPRDTVVTTALLRSM